MGLTGNLFWGQGERDHRLRVVEGTWPDDVTGSVVVVGPDQRAPGGHWFGGHGLLEKIHLVPDGAGRIRVQHRLVRTRLWRLRRWLPFLFARVAFAEVSPFGVTNLANTNVAAMADRLFVGYDAGRPVEVDPVTLDVVTPVGANDEWLASAPGLVEPLCAVAAHPAVDHDEGCLWFVNYGQVSLPGTAAPTSLARWDLDGPVHRWWVDGMSAFDSIHDVKVSEHHLVFADLPFVIEPGSVTARARSRRIQDHTTLWIVAKADLATTPPGGRVRATEVRVPMPTGHLWVDHDEVDGRVRLVLQQIPLGDLLLTVTAESRVHGTGELTDPGHTGALTFGLQPTVFTRLVVDPATGEVADSATAVDADRVWGGVLATTDVEHPEARSRLRRLWTAGTGFDPAMVTEAWWRLYGDAEDGVVAPADLPAAATPGTLATVDVEQMVITDVWPYEDGAFPSPPTFVPRAGARGPDDGYVVVVVHRDGPKEIQVFDAADVAAGPVARASAPDFRPSLLLHSCWVPDRRGPRPSRYRVGLRRDLVGALRCLPGVARSYVALVGDARRARPGAGGSVTPK